jgi:glucokinase
MSHEGQVSFSAGIDVGASKVRIGILDSEGRLLVRRTADIRDRRGESAAALEFIRGETAAAVREAGLPPEKIDFIGLGFPGTVDEAGQSIDFAPNLGWRNVAVAPHFRGFSRASLGLIQDARAAAFGEYLLGSGRGTRVLVCITLGTGIGAGIVMDGRIYHGSFNTAGEVGHMLVEEDGLACACGRSGCLEAYSSGTAIVKAARQWKRWNGGPALQEAVEVFRLAADGDAEARALVARAGRFLGLGIVNVVNLLSPDAVIISGGMCGQEELLLSPVRQYVLAHAYALSVREGRFRLVRAELGEDAPMIGAGMIYRGL